MDTHNSHSESLQRIVYLVELCIVRVFTFTYCVVLYIVRVVYLLLSFVITLEFCIVLVYVHAHVIGYVSDCVLLGVVMCYYHLLCNLWVFCCIG